MRNSKADSQGTTKLPSAAEYRDRKPVV